MAAEMTYTEVDIIGKNDMNGLPVIEPGSCARNIFP